MVFAQQLLTCLSLPLTAPVYQLPLNPLQETRHKLPALSTDISAWLQIVHWMQWVSEARVAAAATAGRPPPPRTNRSLPGGGRFMKWGRWEGAEERQVERIGGSMPGREGATTSLSLLHSSPSSSSCGGASRGCISSGALYLARSTRSGIASPHHTFPPEPGLQSLLEWQIPTVVLWEGGQKLYSQSLNVATQRGVMPLPILGIPIFFLQNWHLLELKLKLPALKRISNLVLCKLLFPDRYIQH